MQQPAPGVPDGDRAVASGVTAEGHEQDLRVQPVQRPDRVEAEPGVALGFRIRHPVRAVRPLGGAVADAVLGVGAGRRHRGAVFGLGQVDLGPGEVGQTSRVVEVEVAEHDVPYALRPEAQPGHLVQRGLRQVQHGLGPAEEVRAEILLGRATSAVPMPLSTRTRPSRSVSTSRQ